MVLGTFEESEMSELSIPEFLQRPKSSGPLKRHKLRWKRLPKPTRPEGAVWEGAERWEVFIPAELATKRNPAFGQRMVWAKPGSKWCRIADGEAKAKIGMREWNQMAKSGRRVA